MDTQTILAIVLPIIGINSGVLVFLYHVSKDVGKIRERVARIEGGLGINPGSKKKEKEDA